MTIALAGDLRSQIVDHCIAGLPNEGCGLLAFEGDRVMRVYPTGNDDASPTSYTVPPQEHYDALVDAEAEGWELEGAFHSHPGGPLAMSDTDVARALRPHWVYLVIDLSGGRPGILAWRDGREIALNDYAG